MNTHSGSVHECERQFHDAWAAGECAEGVEIDAAFEAMTAPENRFILTILGDLRGKRLLDVGTGLGESAIYFAKRGADVTAVDISPRMIELCAANARRHGVELTTHVATGEDLGLPADSFDIVYAANLLHHIHDRERFLRNMRQVLKPGGVFVTWDPLKYNPVINVYRRKATGVRTPDEAPLGVADLRLTKKYFPDLRHRSFWMTTMILFLKYYFVDGKDPNQVRYWKAILRESPGSIGWWFRPLQALDRALLCLPGVNMLAWNVVLWGTKGTEAGESR
jgi:SAM-dependent methyltransferase